MNTDDQDGLLSDEEIEAYNEELSKLVKEAYAALKKATDFADKHKLMFRWDPAYGMGGRYYGDPINRHDDDGYGNGGWSPSSLSC